MSWDDDANTGSSLQNTLESLTSRLAIALRSAPSPAHATAARSAVHAVVKRNLSSSRRRNDCNVFVSLPPRVLYDVLLRLHPLDRVAVSQTCYYLRRYTLSQPGIWANLSKLFDYRQHWSPFRPLPLVRTLVQRSYPVQLKLYLYIDAFKALGYEGLLLLCKDNMARMVDLSLLFYLQYGPDDDLTGHSMSRAHDALPLTQSLMLHLSYAAPTLEHFEIKVPTPTILAPNTFAGMAPRLRCFSMSRVRLKWQDTYPAFAFLTTFCWEDKSIDPSKLLATIQMMPRLINLQLLCGEFGTGTEAYQMAPAPFAFCRLQNLMVGHMHSGLGRFLKFVSRMPLRRLVIPISLFDGPLSLWQSILAVYPVISRLSIGLPLAEASVATVVGATPVIVRIPSSGATGLLRSYGSHVHLTTLAIHEFALWDDNIGFLDAPALMDLRILLASCYYSSFYVYYIGALQDSGRPRWVLPKLQNFQLSYHCAGSQEQARCRCGKVLTIALSDVHEFVSRALLYRRPRLASLTLSGVEIVDLDAHVWLSRLYELFDDVDISATSRPISADAPRGIWDQTSSRDFCRLFTEPLIWP